MQYQKKNKKLPIQKCTSMNYLVGFHLKKQNIVLLHKYTTLFKRFKKIYVLV